MKYSFIRNSAQQQNGHPKQGRRKALKSEEAQRLNRTNLYGKNPIPVQKL